MTWRSVNHGCNFVMILFIPITCLIKGAPARYGSSTSTTHEAIVHVSGLQSKVTFRVCNSAHVIEHCANRETANDVVQTLQ